MKHKTGKVGGFIIGVAGFLLLFKIFILDHIPPSDELAPGMVLLAALFNGLLFGFFGSRIQRHFTRRNAE
jgi:hypothetical protein